jgi:hypothetical protein
MRGWLNLEVEMYWCWGWWRIEDDVVDVTEILPLCQGGVGGDDSGDFAPVAAADQPYRGWKKGSASAAPLENYGKNMASLFRRNEGIHKMTETRRRPRVKQDLVAQPSQWAAPPRLFWASWPNHCHDINLNTSAIKEQCKLSWQEYSLHRELCNK